MSTESPQRRTIAEIDAREARRRGRFAQLALIAPTPEMIRAVLALEARSDPDDPPRTAVIDIVPDRGAVTADR